MPASEQKMAGGPPRRMMLLALAGAIVLAAAGGAAFYYASQQRRGGGEGDLYQVSVSGKACAPNEITVPGGKRSFEIANASDRPIEWEILDGAMVVAERENIAPGFKQTLSVELAPGDYAITCGLLSNPRGMLHVMPSEEARQAATTISLRDFIGPLSEYKVYLVQQSAAAVGDAEQLAEAIKAGDLERARALWQPARLPYKRIEPVAYRLSDLENAIDPVADYLEGREQDAAFTGYHRIEYGLFEEDSLEGLAPVADRLVVDLQTLKERLSGLKLDPALLIAIPGGMAGQLAHGRLMQGEDHYARTDLDDTAANLEGIRKIAGLLQVVVEPVDPELEATIGAKLDAVDAHLAALRKDDRFPPYDTIDQATRAALTKAFEELAQALDQLQPVIRVG